MSLLQTLRSSSGGVTLFEEYPDIMTVDEAAEALRVGYNRIHEGLILPVPNRPSVQIPVVYHAFHVICEYMLRDPHVLKGVDHSNKQIFCFAFGKNSMNIVPQWWQQIAKQSTWYSAPV